MRIQRETNTSPHNEGQLIVHRWIVRDMLDRAMSKTEVSFYPSGSTEFHTQNHFTLMQGDVRIVAYARAMEIVYGEAASLMVKGEQSITPKPEIDNHKSRLYGSDDDTEESMTPQITPGQKLWFVPEDGRFRKPYEIEVEKVGRVWATIKNSRMRLNIETLRPQEFPHGQAWVSKDEWRAAVDKQQVWDEIRDLCRNQYSPPSNISVDTLRQICAAIDRKTR